MMTEDPQLLKKLIDDDEIQDVEVQKGGYPGVVTGHPIKTPSLKKKTKSRKGCPCWCKCIGFTMLTFVFLFIFAVGYAYSVLTELVEDFTVETDTPRKFPVVTMSEGELNRVAHRVEHFFDDVMDEKTGIEDLVINQDEINGFFGHSDYLRGNAMITLHKDRFDEEFSLPMDILGFESRYFAGSEYVAFKTESAGGFERNKIVEMNVETEAKHEDWFDGPLMFMKLHYMMTENIGDEKLMGLYLEKGYFFGELAPQGYVDMEEFYDNLDDADTEEVIRKLVNGIESVSIEEGKMVIKARNPSSN